MKYLFGDSSEFPMQKNFLELLNNFIDISIKSIELENSVIDVKKNMLHRQKVKDCVLRNLNNILAGLDKMIEVTEKEKEHGQNEKEREKEHQNETNETANDIDIDANFLNLDGSTILECCEKSKEILKSGIEEKELMFVENMSLEILEFDSKIGEIDNKNKEILGPFFSNTLPQIINSENNKNYLIGADKEGYIVEIQTNYDNGISHIFKTTHETSFWEDYIKVSDLIRGIKIPIKMKKALFKKEMIPEIINIDDYIISDIRYTNSGKDIKDVEIVLKNNIDNPLDRFRMNIDITNNLVEIYHGEETNEENISTNAELAVMLDITKFKELGEKVIEQINMISPKEPYLETLYLNGEDVFTKSNIFELMLKIAEIISPTIIEIKNHGIKNELILKEELNGGERREIYIKTSQIKDKLSSIKEKGDILYKYMGIE